MSVCLFVCCWTATLSRTELKVIYFFIVLRTYNWSSAKAKIVWPTDRPTAAPSGCAGCVQADKLTIHCQGRQTNWRMRQQLAPCAQPSHVMAQSNRVRVVVGWKFVALSGARSAGWCCWGWREDIGGTASCGSPWPDVTCNFKAPGHDWLPTMQQGKQYYHHNSNTNNSRNNNKGKKQ